MIINQFPIAVKFHGEFRILQLEFSTNKNGESEITVLDPNLNFKYAGSFDRDMGGCLTAFGVDIEADETEYVDLERQIFQIVLKEIPFFFTYEVKESFKFSKLRSV